jgi:ferric-dicitrate binding protein FerR (iron transport regulator)
MNDQTTDINEIIIRYLDESATLEEKQLLLQWLKASDKNRAEFNGTRDLWLSCDAALSGETELNAALNRLRFRILNPCTPVRQPKILIGWRQAAAIILVLLGMSYRFAIRPPVSVEKETCILNRLITAGNSKGKFILPDSTVVWLNANSKLTCPEKFDDDRRLVQLEGEGYFEVAGNKNKPFVVQSGDLAIEALGTAFDISCYPFRHTTEVVLLNGSVKIASNRFDRDVIIKPDQMLEYRHDRKTARVQGTKAHLHVDWIKDRLVFDNTRLSDIMISLEGWYNVSIQCPASFAEKTRLSFTVRNETVNEILKAISLIIPVRYSIAENVVTVTPK